MNEDSGTMTISNMKMNGKILHSKLFEKYGILNISNLNSIYGYFPIEPYSLILKFKYIFYQLTKLTTLQLSHSNINGLLNVPLQLMYIIDGNLLISNTKINYLKMVLFLMVIC